MGSPEEAVEEEEVEVKVQKYKKLRLMTYNVMMTS